MASDRERIQLNLRLDGQKDLLEAIKSAAEAEGTSVNAWVVSTLKAALGVETSAASPVVAGGLEAAIAPVLDKLLADRLADIKASQASAIEQLRAELGESVA
jgi:hypothetical protein